MDEKFISDMQSDISLGRWDKVLLKNEEVAVVSNQGEGLQEKRVVYDVSEEDLQILTVRIEQTVSFYINKYEKINRIVQGLGLIINRYQMVKDIWKYESEYQMDKLKLIDKDIIILHALNSIVFIIMLNTYILVVI